MTDWHTIETAPRARTVMTKIDYGMGARNEQALYLSDNLWFVPDGSMYVYYSPTHWRELTASERGAEAVKLNKALLANNEALKRAMAALQ